MYTHTIRCLWPVVNLAQLAISEQDQTLIRIRMYNDFKYIYIYIYTIVCQQPEVNLDQLAISEHDQTLIRMKCGPVPRLDHVDDSEDHNYL